MIDKPLRESPWPFPAPQPRSLLGRQRTVQKSLQHRCFRFATQLNLLERVPRQIQSPVHRSLACLVAILRRFSFFGLRFLYLHSLHHDAKYLPPRPPASQKLAKATPPLQLALYRIGNSDKTNGMHRIKFMWLFKSGWNSSITCCVFGSFQPLRLSHKSPTQKVVRECKASRASSPLSWS